LVKKYGGAVIALTLDESGIPDTVSGRVALAKKIINKASEYGIGKNEIIVDPLCLTISSDKDSANVTLQTVKALHEEGIKTSLGVSNVSFGLPEREKINTVFFCECA
jgi:5-methyltetrahydrofolate--homocysteine methyltransferase